MTHTVQRGDKPVTEAWAAERANAGRLKPEYLRELVSADDGRFGRLCLREDDVAVGLSKEKRNADVLAALLDLARAEAPADASTAGLVARIGELGG